MSSEPIPELITDFAALQALRPQWQALSARLPENTDFFASWDYTWAYLNFHRPTNWLVVAMREVANGPLVAVFPLKVFQIEHEGQVFRACQPLGVGYLPYIEFPVEGQLRRDVLQVLLNTVLQQQLGVEVAIFWPLHQASPLYLSLLEDLGRSEVLKTLRFPNNLHEIETRGRDFDHYLAACSSTSFQNAAYCQRRLCAMGALSFTLSEWPEAMPSVLETLCQQNQKKFAGRHAFSRLPQWPAFISDLAVSLSQACLAQLSTLRLDGRVIAGGVSFLHKRRRYLYLMDYNPEFARYSPLKILLANLIEQTFKEQGVFCFGAGSSAYKRDWAPALGEFKAAIVFFSTASRAALDTQLTGPGLNSLGGVQ